MAIDLARTRVVFHGAVLLLLGLVAGFANVVEWDDERLRLWRSAHLGLVLLGLWLLATASVLPALLLDRRELRGLVAALFAMAYGLAVATALELVIGARVFQPGGSPLHLLAFVANTIGVLGALLAALITMKGARAAINAARGR